MVLSFWSKSFRVLVLKILSFSFWGVQIRLLDTFGFEVLWLSILKLYFDSICCKLTDFRVNAVSIYCYRKTGLLYAPTTCACAGAGSSRLEL